MYEKTRYGVCSICMKNTIISDHHLLPQRKYNRKLYGDLLDDDKNLVKGICVDCHSRLKHISEPEFCKKMNIEVKSKSGKNNL